MRQVKCQCGVSHKAVSQSVIVANICHNNLLDRYHNSVLGRRIKLGTQKLVSSSRAELASFGPGFEPGVPLSQPCPALQVPKGGALEGGPASVVTAPGLTCSHPIALPCF